MNRSIGERESAQGEAGCFKEGAGVGLGPKPKRGRAYALPPHSTSRRSAPRALECAGKAEPVAERPDLVEYRFPTALWIEG